MIVALEDAKYKLLGMRESIEELGSALRIEETKELLFDLEAQTQAPDFWNNAEKAQKGKLKGYFCSIAKTRALNKIKSLKSNALLN